ncbi:YceI family protein [Oceanimonas sp. NS1]|nr:YceI family protein [Oceanimonas sp. NS1]
MGEPNHFERVSGTLSDAGRFELTIDLASVESGIPIRNERLEEYLFETGRFPKLTLSADLSGQLEALTQGEDRVIETDATLNLHGTERPCPSPCWSATRATAIWWSRAGNRLLCNRTTLALPPASTSCRSWPACPPSPAPCR